jgi:hypothetical protein
MSAGTEAWVDVALGALTGLRNYSCRKAGGTTRAHILGAGLYRL